MKIIMNSRKRLTENDFSLLPPDIIYQMLLNRLMIDLGTYLDSFREPARTMMVKWCESNIKGLYRYEESKFNPDYILFENQEDLLAFKLRFEGMLDLNKDG